MSSWQPWDRLISAVLCRGVTGWVTAQHPNGEWEGAVQSHPGLASGWADVRQGLALLTATHGPGTGLGPSPTASLFPSKADTPPAHPMSDARALAGSGVRVQSRKI